MKISADIYWQALVDANIAFWENFVKSYKRPVQGEKTLARPLPDRTCTWMRRFMRCVVKSGE